MAGVVPVMPGLWHHCDELAGPNRYIHSTRDGRLLLLQLEDVEVAGSEQK